MGKVKFSPRVASYLGKKIPLWRRDVELFARDVFGITPDPWQRIAYREASSDDRELLLAYQSCAGTGKTNTLAVLAFHTMFCFGSRLHHPRGIATSMNRDNLADGLIPELAKWHDKSGLMSEVFERTTAGIFHRDFQQTWRLSFRSYRKDASPEERARALSGIHSRIVFFLLDEMGGQPPEVLDAAKQALGDADVIRGMIAGAGNPMDKNSALYQATVKEGPPMGWRVQKITAHPDDPNRTPRRTKKYARDAIEAKGIDHPWVQVFILGEWADHSMVTLLSDKEFDDSVKAEIPDQSGHDAVMGIDVSRDGVDGVWYSVRRGLCVEKMGEIEERESHDLASRVYMIAKESGVRKIYVDNTGGYGIGLIDVLGRMATGIEIYGVKFSKKALKEDSYLNRRVEMWFGVRDFVRAGGRLIDDEKLKEELTTIMTWYDKKDRHTLESKDELKARIKRSPDRADSVALTFGGPQMIEPKLDPVDQFIRETRMTGRSRRKTPLERHFGSDRKVF